MDNNRRLTTRDFINRKSVLTFFYFSAFLLCLFFLIYGLNNWIMKAALDASFACCALGLGIGVLSYATNQGTFDIFAVGFENLTSTLKKDGVKKYDMYTYREAKSTDRRSNRFICLVYLLDGVIFLIPSLVIYFICFA